MRFRNLLSELSGERIVILSTHIVSDVEAVATDIALIAEGNLVTHGAPEQLLSAVERASLGSGRAQRRPGRIAAEVSGEQHRASRRWRARARRCRYAAECLGSSAGAFARRRLSPLARRTSVERRHPCRAGYLRMNSPRILYQLARADFLERVRRYSFLLTLVFAMYLGYATATGRITLRLGDYRGVYTSAWIGVLVSVVTTCFVSLVGFYIVKNSIDRDRQTRVGQILASTPLSKAEYLVGKLLSNFAVLALMVIVLAFAAVAMQIFHGEDSRFDLWAMLSPFLLLALPAMALTAAIAVLFESVSFLSGGFGNVVWFFMWSFGVALPAWPRTRCSIRSAFSPSLIKWSQLRAPIFPATTEDFRLPLQTIGKRR